MSSGRGLAEALFRLAVVLALVVSALSFTASNAFAHLGLEGAIPAAGSTLSTAPGELRLRFTEEVEAAVAFVTLLGPHGEVPLAPLFTPPDSGAILVAGISGPLTSGTYTVSWRVPGTDGHPVSGEYTFTIAAGAAGLAMDELHTPGGAGPGVPGMAPPPAEHHVAASAGGFGVESPLYAAVRWLTFVGLLGVIGGVAFRAVLALVGRSRLAMADALIVESESGAARLGLWAVAILGVAAVLRLLAQSAALHGSAEAATPELVGTLLTRTIWGWGWMLQVAGAAVAALGLAIVRKRARLALRRAEPLVATPEPVFSSAAGPEHHPASASPQRHLLSGARLEDPGEPRAHRAARTGAGWFLAGIGAAALAVTPALSGHAVASESLVALALLADTLHVVGAGGWMGGLLFLLVIGVPAALRIGGAERGLGVALLVNAFSPAALAFAGVTVGTGVFAAWLHLGGSLPALWESGYGRTLMLKLVAVSVVFFTGAYNWLRVRPALGSESAAGRLRRSATVELTAGVVVIVITAILVASSPPEL